MEEKPTHVYLVYKREESNYCPEVISICFEKERAETVIGLPKKTDEGGREYFEHHTTKEGRFGKRDITTFFWIEKRKTTR